MSTDFQVPKITAETIDDTKGSFVIEPLDKGFGYTYGSSLRRVLLSSLAGAAIPLMNEQLNGLAEMGIDNLELEGPRIYSRTAGWSPAFDDEQICANFFHSSSSKCSWRSPCSSRSSSFCSAASSRLVP